MSTGNNKPGAAPVKREGHVRSEVNKRLEAIRALKAEIDWMLKDQPVKIIGRYNGQPYGRSRKSLTGEIRRISHF